MGRKLGPLSELVLRDLCSHVQSLMLYHLSYDYHYTSLVGAMTEMVKAMGTERRTMIGNMSSDILLTSLRIFAKVGAISCAFSRFQTTGSFNSYHSLELHSRHFWTRALSLAIPRFAPRIRVRPASPLRLPSIFWLVGVAALDKLFRVMPS